MPTHMLIDGNSLTYRAFHALPTDLATASGQVTNAVFGFTSMLINLLRDHQPDRVAIAFDLPQPTFRHERIETYKANRSAAPDILKQQMGLVRQVVDVLAIPTVELAGFEADDVIATLATEARDRADDVIVVTGDRDSYQLVEDPHVKVLYNKRGVSDYAFYDEAGIEERTGVKPSDYVLYAALRGDNSDNLPGVPGVGEKTAAKLINTYRTLDELFAHVDDQTPKLRQNLSENEERVRINAEVMLLVRDAPVTLDLDHATIGDIDVEEVRQLFEFLEFRSLFDRLSEVLDLDGFAGASTGEVLEAEMVAPDTVDEALAALAAIEAGDGLVGVAASWRGTGQRSTPDLLALTSAPEQGEVTVLSAAHLADEKVVAALTRAFSADGRPFAIHDAKPLVGALDRLGLDAEGLALDTSLAAYLLDPGESRYLLAELLARYTEYIYPEGESAPEGQLDLGGGDQVDNSLEVARRALATDRLTAPLLDALEQQGLLELNDTIEVPLVAVLARMENLGVGVDRAELQRLSDQLAERAEKLAAAVQDDAGEEFNVNSTKQLREILFEKLGLTPQKKTKTGYSTDASTLEKLKGEHPIVDHLLEYREVEKLRSTYGEALLAEIADDGRIHATFNQTVARTGRLSSEEPNLHNIPVRSEMGRVFRRVFVPEEGYELLVADYNQIELRCIAHLAEDPGLITAFTEGHDIHTETASQVFAVEPADVTIEQRSKAKMVSYGLAYGMEAYGLGQRLAIPTDEASVILDSYFEAFPAVKKYMDDTVAEARERGYTETLFGRRRQIPELASRNFRIRQAGERQAMNAGIQGLAADIFKVALVRLDRELRTRKLSSRLILQVHDEVILEVPPEEHDAMCELVVGVMADAFDLMVPLEVNLATGPSWAEAKG
ncbi:MAG: DNA polymerase I [Actinomycetia bacterium]|nr:DNA polymerase I [Actinomycetes bacterium]